MSSGDANDPRKLGSPANNYRVMQKLEPQQVEQLANPVANLLFEGMGKPGARAVLHSVPMFEGRAKPDEAVFQDYSLRSFVVSARLSRRTASLGDMGHINAELNNEEGDSYLIAAPGSTGLECHSEYGDFNIIKNIEGELSNILFRCDAHRSSEARALFIEASYPTLDKLSYAYNVALHVVAIRVEDVNHRTYHIECVSPFRTQVISASIERVPSHLRPIYSLYREAKNTESDFYKFLCFYKIMEGLLGPLRADIRREAKIMGVELKFSREIVPDDDYLPKWIHDSVGTPIKGFFDKVLRDKFRNVLAHFMTEDGALHLSSAEGIDAFAHLAFVCDLCVRVLIANHEELLRQIGKA